MNFQKMKLDSDSLFSLEVVVEKLYVPHEFCRFPSVAFRLLDFPTILINHVEDDLAAKIRRKVSADPYFELPKQISELKDKHGNYVIKKGKSCLLKLPFETIQTHLLNTPMYVMIIDSYPQVPKLLGNTTVALDQEIKDIAEDIRRLGDTVPSVHGDKGLFKVFNLMGKEIGYIILGYRLMCLGSGLIPHIPEHAIAQRESENVETLEQEVRVNVQPQSSTKRGRDNFSYHSDRHAKQEKMLISQEMGSMTEPEKHEVLLQTIDMCDKEIHVALSDTNAKPKDVQTISTQTQRRQHRPHQKSISIQLKAPSDENEEDIFVDDILHPPPLFYNKENEPKVQIHRPYLYYQDDAASIYTDDLTIDDDEPVPDGKITKSEHPRPKSTITPKVQPKFVQQKQVPPNPQPVAQTLFHPGFQNLVNGFPGSISNGPLFPILTALLNELSKIQDPKFVETAVNQVNTVAHERKQFKPASRPQQLTQIKDINDIKHLPTTKDTHKQDKKETVVKDQKFQRTCATHAESVPKKKGWIRQASSGGVNKSKLAFGLTNTQRLRLAKVNPDWLRTQEKEENEAKLMKMKTTTVGKVNDEEFETGNLSDTLTEVRRLAEKNLNEADDTLQQSATFSPSAAKNRRKVSPPRRKKGSSPSPVRKRSKSPKHKYLSNVQITSKSESQDDGLILEDDKDKVVSEEEEVRSYKSLEVRIPSALMYEEDSDFTDSPKSYKYPGYINSKDSDSFRSNDQKFPGFIDQNVSVPESINGKTNMSLNSTKDLENDDDQPLESTRYSKPYKSHDDIDTRQFQSTDEPELQKLMSSGEKSEVSDILSTTDRSIYSPMPPSDINLASARFQVLNPKASMQSPLPAIRKSHTKLEGSVTKTSPAVTPRSPSGSRNPTPTPRKKTLQRKRMDFKPDSIHTESVSSYVPSDDDILGNEEYSDEFNSSSRMSPEVGQSSKWIPSTKLGYTIS